MIVSVFSLVRVVVVVVAIVIGSPPVVTGMAMRAAMVLFLFENFSILLEPSLFSFVLVMLVEDVARCYQLKTAKDDHIDVRR